MTVTPDLMDRFYNLMLEVRDVTGKLDKRIGSIEGKMDIIREDIKDRVGACSMEKQGQLNELKRRIEVLESWVMFGVRTILALVICAVLYGGYVVVK